MKVKVKYTITGEYELDSSIVSDIMEGNDIPVSATEQDILDAVKEAEEENSDGIFEQANENGKLTLEVTGAD